MTAEKTLTGTAKWITRVSTVICVALLIASCYFLVKIGFLLFGAVSAGEAPELYGVTPVAAQESAKDQQRVDASVIANWNLFGNEVVAAAEQPQAVIPEEVRETTLQLTLHGVFVAEEQGDSTAIISEQGRESKLYHVGDPLPGRVKLAEVRQDSVLLNRNGSIEALYFPDRGQGFKPSNQRTAGPSRGGPVPPGGHGFVPPPRSADSGDYNQRVESLIRNANSASEVAIAMKQDMDSRSPESALQDLGLQTNGGRGYKIMDGGSMMFAAIGGRPGDVILSINGRTLGDPAADFSMAEEIMSDCNATISMERNGHTFTNKLSLCAN